MHEGDATTARRFHAGGFFHFTASTTAAIMPMTQRPLGQHSEAIEVPVGLGKIAEAVRQRIIAK
jgi:hypothetical protein